VWVESGGGHDGRRIYLDEVALAEEATNGGKVRCAKLDNLQ